jgi:KAP family P-loop domain
METTDDVVDPWAECKLGRKTEAKKLERLAESIWKERRNGKKDGSYTINIDARWGEGKTTFIKNWMASLKSNHLVVYVNAWKMDYIDDPLLAFCIELDATIESFRDNKSGSTNNQSRNKIVKLAKACVPLLLKGLLMKMTGVAVHEFELSDEDGELAKELSGKLASEIIGSFNEQRSANALIEKQLSELVDQVDNSSNFQLPIYIFVDELDRCKPSYAIQVLERIKHIFDVTGIQFIIATDTEQLEHTIKSVYGSGFDARRYLRRFFDLQYHFPSIKTRDYAQFLFSSENAPWHQNLFIPEIKALTPVDLFNDISLVFNWSMRDQLQIYEKMAALARLDFDSKNKLHIVPALFYLGLKEALDEKEYFEACSMRNTIDMLKNLKILVPGAVTPPIKKYENSVQNPQSSTSAPISIIGINDFYLQATALSDADLNHKSQRMVAAGCEYSIYNVLYEQRKKGPDTPQVLLKDYPKLIASVGSFKEIKETRGP